MITVYMLQCCLSGLHDLVHNTVTDVSVFADTSNKCIQCDYWNMTGIRYSHVILLHCI